MYKVAIFASGSGSNALKIINFFKKSDLAQVVLVLSNNENAGVKQHANAHNIDFKYVKNDIWRNNPEQIVSLLEDAKVDLIILAGFLLLIPDLLIKSFSNRILNIHPALLPEFGGKGMYGMNVHKAVKAEAKKETGMTIHLVNEKYDDGEILFQAKVLIDEEDDAESIQKKVLNLEHEWYPKIIERFIKERLN